MGTRVCAHPCTEHKFMFYGQASFRSGRMRTRVESKLRALLGVSPAFFKFATVHFLTVQVGV